MSVVNLFFVSSRRRHTRCALVTGVQTWLFRSPDRVAPPPPSHRNGMTGFSKIAFVAARGDAAGAARDRLAARYGDAKPSEAELIVALGGDGFMLQTLHKYMTRNVDRKSTRLNSSH